MTKIREFIGSLSTPIAAAMILIGMWFLSFPNEVKELAPYFLFGGGGLGFIGAFLEFTVSSIPEINKSGGKKQWE